MSHREYVGGCDLENVTVCFSKFEPGSNTDKIFQMSVSRDLFGGYSLHITKGRLANPSRSVVRGHDGRLELMNDLVALSARRFDHGYRLTKALLTDDLVPFFETWLGENPNPRDNADIDTALHQCLSLLRNRAAKSARFEDFAGAFEKTIFSLDPQQSHRDGAGRSSAQPELPDLVASACQDFTAPRRRVVRFLVEELLRDEPLVRQSIFRALQVPGRFQGNNIVNFESIRRSEKGGRNLRLLTLIEQEPRITDLGERLFHSGIKTVCELIKFSEAQLIQIHQATSDEIVMLRYVLGSHGLHLAADIRTEVKV